MESPHHGALLLVDDEPVHLDALARCLERAGYALRRAHSGADALELIRSQPIDLVLLDVMMPGMSGLETLQVIRQRTSGARLPVIMLTSSDRSDDVIEALDLGANDYLTKPVELAVAMARIRTHVACCRSESARREHDAVSDAGSARIEGLWDWNAATRQLRLSTDWSHRLRWDDTGAGASIDTWFHHVHAADVARVRTDFDAHLQGRTPRFVSEHRLTHGDGTCHWVLMTGVAFRDSSGHIARVTGVLTDRTQARLTDPLTGLPNRASCMDRLQSLLVPGVTVPRSLAVLVLDLDRFSHVNERLGHAIGDEVLREVGRRLEKALRTTDLVIRHLATDAPPALARVCGDEFTLVVDQLSQPLDALLVADRLLAAVKGPYRVAGTEVALTASIGMAYAISVHTRPDDVLCEADAALRHAKHLGGDRFEVFTPALRQQMEQEFLLEADLRWALERGEFALQFAPIVRSEGRQLSGFAVDACWHSPSRGVLPPDAFLSIAEACGLIVPLERWMLREACAHMARWQGVRADGVPLMMHAPVSRAQCVTGDFVEFMRRVLLETGLPPAALTLDLDDRLCVVVDDAIGHSLTALRALGVRLGVGQRGDGGTLAGLARHPFDALRVLATALVEEDHDEDAETIVPAVLRVARSLTMRVTVAGLETEAQLLQLHGLGGAYATGPVLGAPVAAHDVEALIRARTHHPQDVALSA